MRYDKQLSVNRNEACAFCHMPETGFTGPVSELNRTTADQQLTPKSRVLSFSPIVIGTRMPHAADNRRHWWRKERAGEGKRPRITS
jgi:cytochrome c peroxidase